jgi:dTDP-4-amino-4,6-dideoxygalactose transaminase
MPVQMDRLLEIAGDIPVIEDCALAVGSRYKGIHAGLWGLLGVFSFYPAKHMTTSEGGMIILRDEALTKRLARQKAFGVDRAFHERKTPGIYDVTLLGYNYRMSEIHAAIGREQVKKLPDFHTQRKKNYEALEKELRQIPEISLFETSNQDFESSYYCMSVLLKGKHAANRSAIIDHMKSCGIGTSVYYPKPVRL